MHPGKSVPVIAGIVMLLTLAAGAVYWLGSDPPRSARDGANEPAHAPGALTIETTPPGAAISLDGDPTGLTTPATLSDGARGHGAACIAGTHHPHDDPHRDARPDGLASLRPRHQDPMTEPDPTTPIASPPTRGGSVHRPTPLQSNVTPRRGRSFLLAAIAMLLSVGLGVLWTLLARRELATAEVQIAGAQLDQARAVFAMARASTQTELQRACRLLVEDPRLKATLAVEGMDAATIADILNDLGKLRGAGFLMVLSPGGRVFAEAGAPELRGQDLADSSVVKRAGEVAEAAVGQWVIGGKMMDLSIMAPALVLLTGHSRSQDWSW